MIYAMVFLIMLCAATLYALFIIAATLTLTKHELARLRRLYIDAMNTLAARQADMDDRDGEIARLRQVRREYVEHLAGNVPRSVRQLRRETWRN